MNTQVRANLSLAESLGARPEPEIRAILAELTDKQCTSLKYDWKFWARSEQLPPPGDWTTWLYLAGRGAGKTRSGAEWIRSLVESGKANRIALVASNAADARDVMVEGESGLLAVCPPWNAPKYEPSKRRLTWPNGAIATLYSAEEPDVLRGPQHDAAWADEAAKWQYAQDCWDNLQFGLRLGVRPRQIVTTTPRNIKLLKDIIAREDTVISRGSTFDNRSNLAKAFLDQIVRRYQGTRLGRQELEGALLEDVPGALWERSRIDLLRVAKPPELTRIVVAVDPPISSEEGSDECGIIVAGKSAEDHAYILADLSKEQLTPNQWARRAVDAFHRYNGDCLVAEANQGGEMVKSVLRQEDSAISIKLVHASKGKAARAEPAAALYEQNRVHHCGSFHALEDQMCAMTLDYDRGKQPSPDRMDALVWALAELMPSKAPREFKVW